jgi:hypothetical protein
VARTEFEVLGGRRLKSGGTALIGAIRGLAIFLPWMAAASVGALAAAAIRSNGNFPTVFPYALGLCGLAGAIGFLWFRVSRTLAGTAMIGAAVLLVVLAGAYLSPFFEAGDMAIPIAIFYVIPFGVLTLGIVALYFCLVVLPVGALLLYVSGEFKAQREGLGVSVFDLPWGGWRTAVLLVLTFAPLSVYPFQTESTANRVYEAVDKDCRPNASPSLPTFKVDMDVDLDRSEWPQLRQMAEKYGAAHGLRVVPGNQFGVVSGNGAPGFRLCRPKQLMFLFLSKDDEYGSNFEPRGDSYFQLSIYAADREEWRKPMMDLVAEIVATWPGTRFVTNMDLRPLVTPTRPVDFTLLCRTRPMKQEYRNCLGESAPVRKETFYLQGDSPDKPRLARVMTEFGAAHQMAFATPGGSWLGNLVPLGTNLCGGGALLVADPPAPTKGPPRAAEQPQPWRMAIATYVRTDDPGAQAIRDAFLSQLEAEWPGIVSAAPDVDFCRAMKGAR